MADLLRTEHVRELAERHNGSRGAGEDGGRTPVRNMARRIYIWPPHLTHPLFSRAGFHGLSDRMRHPRPTAAGNGKEPYEPGDSYP
jgi:hypothetical protein